MVLAEPRSQLGNEPTSPASSNSSFDEITSEDGISELGGSFTDLALSLIPSSAAVPPGSILYSASPALSATTDANVSVDDEEIIPGNPNARASVVQDGHEAQVARDSHESPRDAAEPAVAGLGLSVQPADGYADAQASAAVPHVLAALPHAARSIPPSRYQGDDVNFDNTSDVFTFNRPSTTATAYELLASIARMKERQIVVVGGLAQRVLAEKYELEERHRELQLLIDAKEEQLNLIGSLGQQVVAQRAELEERAEQLEGHNTQDTTTLGGLLGVVQGWESENQNMWTAAHASSIDPQIEHPNGEENDNNDELQRAVNEYVAYACNVSLSKSC